MNYGIIAAGHGSRMHQEGVSVVKPLVLIAGVPMIERAVDAMIHAGARRIAAVSNPAAPEVADLLHHLQQSSAPCLIPIELDSHNALHSFAAVASELPADEPYCIATVDTVFDPSRLQGFIEAFLADDSADGYMAVSGYIDDEKPLYVNVADDGETITSFVDEAPAVPRYVSAGIYALRPTSRAVIARCIADPECGLRGFQRALAGAGLRLRAYDLGTVIDVDHSADIDTANRYAARWAESQILTPQSV